jgi:hypothetical protein
MDPVNDTDKLVAVRRIIENFEHRQAAPLSTIPMSAATLARQIRAVLDKA